MSFAIVGTGVAVAGATYNIIDGKNKEAAGKRLAEGNKRPWYTIPDEYQQDVNLASSQAQSGLPQSTVNYYNTQANRGLSSGADAILRGGGDADSLSKLYDEFTQGLSKEASDDAVLKSQHINTFINANKDLAGQKTQAWALNYDEPYKDTAQLASQEKAAGAQQVGNGINGLFGAASTFSNSMLYKDPTQGTTLSSPRNELIPQASGAGVQSSGITVPPLSMPSSFSTPGGQAVMSRLGQTDAHSDQLQQLISLLNNQPAQLN